MTTSSTPDSNFGSGSAATPGQAFDSIIAASERAERAQGSASKLFDLRIIIAGLFAFYGIFLLILGIVNTTAEELDKSGGIRVNLYAGIGLLLFAGLFGSWAMARPLIAPDSTDSDRF